MSVDTSSTGWVPRPAISLHTGAPLNVGAARSRASPASALGLVSGLAENSALRSQATRYENLAVLVCFGSSDVSARRVGNAWQLSQ